MLRLRRTTVLRVGTREVAAPEVGTQEAVIQEVATQEAEVVTRGAAGILDTGDNAGAFAVTLNAAREGGVWL